MIKKHSPVQLQRYTATHSEQLHRHLQRSWEFEACTLVHCTVCSYNTWAAMKLFCSTYTRHHAIIPYLANAPHDLQPYHGIVFNFRLQWVPPLSPLPPALSTAALSFPASCWGLAGLGEAAGCVQGLEEASGDYSWGRCRPGGAWAADREGQLGWGPWRVWAGDRGRCWGYEDGAAVRGSQVPIPWDMGTGWEAGDLLNQNIWACLTPVGDGGVAGRWWSKGSYI